MPQKQKLYERVVFTPEVIKEALEVLISTLPDNKKSLPHKNLTITLPSQEDWEHDSEDEFFADYSRGFSKAQYRKFATSLDIDFIVDSSTLSEPYSRVTVKLSNRNDVEKVFNVFEANVDKCRLPEEPKSEQKEIETNWANETISKIKTHCPNVARKLKIALIKIESKDKEEWQSAAVQIRDAWIELSQWLCKAHNIDTSDISSDSVIDRQKKLKLDKSDDKIFNLAKASFQFSMKHHKRDIDLDTAVACVTSTIVSMKTVIQEVFNANTKS